MHESALLSPGPGDLGRIQRPDRKVQWARWAWEGRGKEPGSGVCDHLTAGREGAGGPAFMLFYIYPLLARTGAGCALIPAQRRPGSRGALIAAHWRFIS